MDTKPANVLYFPDRILMYKKDMAKEIGRSTKQDIEALIDPLNLLFETLGGRISGRQWVGQADGKLNYEVNLIDQKNNLFVVNKCSLIDPTGLFTAITYHGNISINPRLIRELNGLYINSNRGELSFTEQDALSNKDLYLHLIRFQPLSEYFMLRYGRDVRYQRPDWTNFLEMDIGK